MITVVSSTNNNIATSTITLKKRLKSRSKFRKKLFSKQVNKQNTDIILVSKKICAKTEHFFFQLKYTLNSLRYQHVPLILYHH